MTATAPQQSSKTSPSLLEKLVRISNEPGVYLMKDGDGNVLYVGKARHLQKRLGAYFNENRPHDMKTTVLVSKIEDIETIVTRSEKEALILESNLIKRYRPRYNVVLKDDKRYPSLRLDPDERYPRFTIARKIGEDDALYFGPFASAHAVRETLKMINKTFKLRKCRTRDLKKRTRPCLHCQMEGCLAPCCMDVDPKIYREQVDEAVMFLRGRTSDLMRKLKVEMQQASQAQEYERAARLRDKIFSLQRTIEKQIAVTTDFKDRDVFAVAGSDKLSVITLLVVRGGFIKGTRHFNFAETMASDEEILGTFMRQYYQKTAFVPAEILVTRPLPDGDLMEDWFRAVKQTRVKINWPRRGEKARLTAMAAQNAAKELEEIRAIQNADMQLLIRLQRRLRLERLPQRIECIDNSNISGVHAVASLVVFEGGKAKKSAYRKYRIKTVHEHDDYAYMSEVLTRRLETKDASEPDVYPDLLMVDGGKGQLNIAVSVLKELQLEGAFEIIAIAKKDEKKGEHQDKIFIPGRANPVIFGREGDLLLFLQKIRDEAHRFAITYHRQRRTKMGLQSVLDTIPGIGSKRKAALLKHFKSIAGIRAASLQDISSLPGFNRKIAENVLQALRVEEKNV